MSGVRLRRYRSICVVKWPLYAVRCDMMRRNNGDSGFWVDGWMMTGRGKGAGGTGQHWP